MHWERLARRQAGVISRRQLEGAGLSPAAITRLCRSGHLERLHRGLFISAAAPVTYEAGLWAAVLGTGGILGFGTAVHLWGYVEESGSEIDVIVHVDNGQKPVRGVRVHRVQLLDGSHQIRHGLPITGRTCTLLDHLGRLREEDAVRLADRALSRSWLTRRDIELRLRRSPGRTGNTVLRRLLDITGDGAAAHSERVLHALLRRAGLTNWIANYDVWADGYLVAVIDVALVELRIAIEVDGMAYHVDPERFQRDRTRQNLLVSLGWEVLRFTWADLTDRPGSTISAILGSCARSASRTTQNRRGGGRS